MKGDNCMAIVTINKELCKGCGLCVRACPKKILKISETFINHQGYHPSEMIDISKCIACAACALTCPDICIEVEK